MAESVGMKGRLGSEVEELKAYTSDPLNMSILSVRSFKVA
jgi:hypothetical protein